MFQVTQVAGLGKPRSTLLQAPMLSITPINLQFS